MTRTRCPVCAARLRPGDAWCGQCHTDLRPRPAAPAVPSAPSAPVAVPAGAVEPDAADGSGSRRTGRRAAGPASDASLTPEEAEALAQEWAERLASTEAGAGLPGLAGRTSGRGPRVALAVGGALAFGALLLLLMTGVGALL